MIRIIIIHFFLLLLVLPAQSKHTYYSKSDTFKVNFNNRYELTSPVIIPNSETVFIHSKKIEKKFYDINYEYGVLSLSDSLSYSIFDTIVVKYLTIRISLKRIYEHRKLVKTTFKGIRDTIRGMRLVERPLTNEAIFGDNIKKSGTIVRGFTLGTNRDLSINSGLRLQLSGRLTDDIEIVAALTDENTPIQPEGNTERLEELDKVFIQIKHTNAFGVFGDYELDADNGEFGRIKRKLQGLKAGVNINKQKAEIAFASARGKFNTMQFNGQDGVQGPYRLTGANNERDIIVIAGSERVYVDGIEMRRGENNDYVIEYSNAELVFTPKRLITSASRITIDFEYTDRRYQRDFFAASGSAKLFDDKFNIAVSYFNENDNQNNPIDLILSDADKEILANAGDNRNLAVRSGVSLAKPDSNGIVKGIYTKIDTVINGKQYSYYKYLPGAVTSLYNVIFSYVGLGNGDYKKVSTGNFIFAGIGGGDYLPLYFLPMPEKREVANIVLETKPIDNLNINFELAGSNFDKNRFSELDNSDNYGYASNIKLSLLPVKLKLAGLNLGKAGFSIRNRFIQNKFQSIDRINEIEFNRNYNLSENLQSDERLTEVNVSYLPVDELKLRMDYGYLKKGENFRSNRLYSKSELIINKVTNSNFIVDYVSSLNGQISSSWMRQTGKADVNYGLFTPGIEYLYENKEEHIKSDSLLNSSLRYLEFAPYLNLSNWKGLSFSAKYSYREEFFPLAGTLEKESKAISQIYSLNYYSGKSFRSTLDVTFRNKKFTPKFSINGKPNNETILVRSDNRIKLFDRFFEGEVYYQTATERTSRLEKIFVRVPVGSGNYVYLGDLNNNGIADEEEFEQSVYDADYILTTVPTDELFPVITLKTNFRWKFNLFRIIKGNSFVEKVLKAISTESVIRIDEKSKEEELSKIYFMNSSALLNDTTTLNGSQLEQHDLYILRHNREISFRFRYQQRRNLIQYASGLSRSYYRLNSLRIKFRMIKEFNNQTDFNFITDNNISPASTKRSRNISTEEVVSDFSYRPYKNVEVGFRLNVSRSEDKYPLTPTIIDNNAQTIRITFSFLGKGRIRFELERNEITSNTNDNYIPFEITRGNAIGKNYLARLNFDYRIANNLQTTINYLGRKQGSGRIIHSLRAEARAYF